MYDDDDDTRHKRLTLSTWWRYIAWGERTIHLTTRRPDGWVCLHRTGKRQVVYTLELQHAVPTRRTMEEQSLDRTTLATISLLEARLLRIEQILHGSTSVSTSRPVGDSATESLTDLERRFATLISRFRVYADILKLCMSLVHPPLPMD